jgi:hypothetical protein
MCCETRGIATRDECKRPTVRLTALVLCALFTAIFIISTVFICVRSNHEHDHDGPDGCCATCMHIQYADKLLKALSTIVAAVSTFIGGIFGALCSLRFATPYCVSHTLVKLKVRLNN